jgi:hypothetical protein
VDAEEEAARSSWKRTSPSPHAAAMSAAPNAIHTNVTRAPVPRTVVLSTITFLVV